MNDCRGLLDKLQEPDIKMRTEENLRWFVEKAVRNKVYYYTLSIISFLAPITINIAMVFSTENVRVRLICAVASGVAAFTTYLLQLLDVRRMWGIYRSQAEMIKSNLALYGLPGHDDPVKFAEKTEDDMAQTHEKWLKSIERR